ncbi:MAG: BamA/TamA family outer membrane protein [Proteobacteria bacterium]|nr:BamA/TamA family outer membrane protein [Pseudomonadota bacterium]
MGAYYSSEELITLRNSFNESLYFNAVTVTPALDRAVNQTIPIQVALQVRPRRAYSAGGGITTDIGPRIRLDYDDRYLNPMGHKLEIDSGFSPIQRMIELNYRIPMTKPSTESLSFSGGILNEDNDTFASESFKLGSTYSLINRNDWRQNYFVNFQHDDYQINEENEIADTLITGINLARTRADDALYPRRGWRLFAQLSGASEDVLSTESFLQFNVNGKLIRSFGPGRFLMNFQAGTTLVDDIGQLPVSVQYFTGGDQSVRGYKYQSLGPTNAAGEVVGGKHFLTGSIEYDFNIRPAWKLAVFADAGNAFNEFNNFEVKKSVGLGLRWMSPIGPIRVDLASALDDDNKFRLHISMGPDL